MAAPAGNPQDKIVRFAALLVIAVLSARSSSAEDQARVIRAAGNSAVRTSSSYARRLIIDGMRRSPTFASEVRELSQSDVIAIVEPSQSLPTGICGHLVFLTARGGFRYVQILFDRRYNVPRTVAIIGHELRHALEVAAHPEVVSPQALGAMYTRIGYRKPDRWTGQVFDSPAAIAAGDAIIEEMLAPPVKADATETVIGR